MKTFDYTLVKNPEYFIRNVVQKKKPDGHLLLIAKGGDSCLKVRKNQ